MKQTLVEWLESQINPYGISPHKTIFEQAKEMEEQQQGYSEEEVKVMYRSLWVGNCFDFDTSYEMETNFEHDFNLWFEQFKNK